MFASSSSNNIHKCHKKQSEALLLLKCDFCNSYAMMSWNTSTDCCIWKGVTCDRSTGDVIGIDLRKEFLSGIIHPNSSLFNLPHLQTLNLAFNNFTGSQIPSEIARFSNSLTHLDLSDCGFSGQVPADITLLHKLVSLDLSLYSEDDHLKLEPHVFINMLRNFTNLEELSLEGVNISSVLPTSLNISSSLKLLNLELTGLQGTLPHYIFNLQSLETLDLILNQFTGDIPSKISVNLTHLTSLRLSYNKLNGTLPSWLFTSPSLEYLFLDDNMFSGNVPFELFALPLLKLLDLSDNQLGGQIDVQTFRQLTNLTYLDLSSNNFSGELELDTLLSSLKNLEYLDLSYNGFSVTTNNANHYVNAGFLFLKLASFKLKVFPESFRAMKQLQYLDLSGNEIHGQIPHWAGEIGRNELYLLNLSNNFITVLPQFQWYGRLEELYLRSNLIEGPFPPSICNMSSLRYLDISHNSIEGVIPQCVGNLSNSLTIMDLGNNSFQGTIPNVFEGFIQLEGLILNRNRLEGGVPSSMSKCEYLRVLDLGNNHLNGTLPGWLGELRFLQVLVLKSNNFHGNIQPSFAVKSPFPGLQVLDLSHNGFVGELPTKYFQNFDSMKNVVKNNTKPQYLDMVGIYYSFVVVVKGVYRDIPSLFVSLIISDLSNNYFERGIPEIIGNLSALRVLNLSHNCLNGRIPYSLRISEIESLDLSWNQLTGKIPQSLTGIKGLEVLNLSQNHLVGRIQEGTQETQFNTFDESSFAGNMGLCGFPLPKCSHKPQLEEHENHGEKSGFTWEVVTLGYGCGTLLGLVMGYLMLSTRKVKWFNLIADAGEHMILERNKRRYVFMGK
ncbi:leucine-rich repeat-containing protein [Tanacetum coccineum]